MKTEAEDRDRTQAAAVAEAAAAFVRAEDNMPNLLHGDPPQRLLPAIEARGRAWEALRAAVTRWEETDQPPPPGSREAVIVYTNWKGETAERRIVPGAIWFGSTKWHPAPQFLLRAFDVDKSAVRDFALKDVREWREAAEDA
jgi:hypothetical protein